MSIRRSTSVAALALVALATSAAAQQAPRPGLTLREVVEATLAHNAQIRIGEWSVRSQEASVRTAAAAFEPTAAIGVSEAQRRTPAFVTSEDAPSSTTSRSLTYDAAVDWRLRSGIVVSPELSFTRADASAQDMPRNTAVAGLNLQLPMLRGRGGGSAVAGERAAEANLDAGRGDLEQLRAGSVLDAISAYWGYVAAVRTLAAMRESEARSQRLEQQTEALIQADQRPAVERLSASANLASKRAARLGAENSVTSARQALALAMGIPARQLATLPPPADDFPAGPDGVAEAAFPSDSALVALALARRTDLAASRTRHSATETLLRGTRADVRSRLDLSVGVGYTGIDAGPGFRQLFSPFYSDRRGAHVSVGFAYAMPLGNAANGGAVLRGTAQERSAALAADELARTIALSVASAAETLRRSFEELRLSQQAVDLRTRSVEAEHQKFQLGTATLIDVIQGEDGLTGETISRINTQRRFAVALATLRYQAGALLGIDGCGPADACPGGPWQPFTPTQAGR
jgi:outer membrane protein